MKRLSKSPKLFRMFLKFRANLKIQTQTTKNKLVFLKTQNDDQEVEIKCKWNGQGCTLNIKVVNRHMYFIRMLFFYCRHMKWFIV